MYTDFSIRRGRSETWPDGSQCAKSMYNNDLVVSILTPKSWVSHSVADRYPYGVTTCTDTFQVTIIAKLFLDPA